jgi:hypothetical protein
MITNAVLLAAILTSPAVAAAEAITATARPATQTPASLDDESLPGVLTAFPRSLPEAAETTGSVDTTVNVAGDKTVETGVNQEVTPPAETSRSVHYVPQLS